MSIKAKRKLDSLRKNDFIDWITSLWLIKRRLVEQKAYYSVLRVDIDDKLQKRLKKAVTGRIHNSDYVLEEYSFLTADQDNRIFTLEAAETDFSFIKREMDKGIDNKKVDTYEELLNSWAYVVKLEQGQKIIYGVRKINKLTKAAKMKFVNFIIFKDKKLFDLEDEKIFSIDTRIDFFVYDGTAFIANKKEFESVMNFRSGMEKNRDIVLNDFTALKIFSDVEPIRLGIGSNLHLLRKISAIQKSRYYKDSSYMKNLLKLNEEEGWGLEIENGSIIINEINVGLVLKLLNNDRLRSPINQEMFDASVKKKVL